MTTIGMKLTRNKFRDVVCAECQRVFITKEGRKLFCDPCGIQRRCKRSKAEQKLTGHARWGSLREIAERRAEDSPSLAAAFATHPVFRWVAITSIPYTPNVSKNRRWSSNGQGFVFLTQAVREFQANLVEHIRECVKDLPVKNAKVWLSIFVQKPNHKSDAINSIDTICDAVKKGIGVDDNWFCIDRVDWEIQKHDPHIYLKIAQESACDMLACSSCGVVSAADTFPPKKNGPFGRSRVCRECLGAMQQERTRLRAEARDAARSA